MGVRPRMGRRMDGLLGLHVPTGARRRLAGHVRTRRRARRRRTRLLDVPRRRGTTWRTTASWNKEKRTISQKDHQPISTNVVASANSNYTFFSLQNSSLDSKSTSCHDMENILSQKDPRWTQRDLFIFVIKRLCIELSSKSEFTQGKRGRYSLDLVIVAVTKQVWNRVLNEVLRPLLLIDVRLLSVRVIAGVVVTKGAVNEKNVGGSLL